MLKRCERFPMRNMNAETKGTENYLKTQPSAMFFERDLAHVVFRKFGWEQFKSYSNRAWASQILSLALDSTEFNWQQRGKQYKPTLSRQQ